MNRASYESILANFAGRPRFAAPRPFPLPEPYLPSDGRCEPVLSLSASYRSCHTACRHIRPRPPRRRHGHWPGIPVRRCYTAPMIGTANKIGSVPHFVSASNSRDAIAPRMTNGETSGFTPSSMGKPAISIVVDRTGSSTTNSSALIANGSSASSPSVFKLSAENCITARSDLW